MRGRLTGALLLTVCAAAVASLAAAGRSGEAPLIDRRALVARHKVTVHGFDPLASLSVGNGDFAFTTDLTGLQTFFAEYEPGVPLGTQSNWGWHRFPNAGRFEPRETLRYFDVAGRQVPYRDQRLSSQRAQAAARYLRENPQRLHLGTIGLLLTDGAGRRARLEDIREAEHELDLWTGEVHSRFRFDGQPVSVWVVCHPELDLVAVRIESPLLAAGRLGVQWEFPYAVAENTHSGADFQAPNRHRSELRSLEGRNGALIRRQLDADEYFVRIEWEGPAAVQRADAHRFVLRSSGSGDSLAFSCLFTPHEPRRPLPSFHESEERSSAAWKDYWQHGGVVDFSACTDPRARELERRTVLSQYLTRIQSAGSLPPAETGLTYNSWYGKFHLEMHWWHVSHFAQWQRPELLRRQLDWYADIRPAARETAREQGYRGVRWPKMVGPSGQNSPSSVGSYLIWQQPHFIFLAEQMYQQHSTRETLEAYRELVFDSAAFMADFPRYNPKTGRYHLEPPLIPAQELWPRETTSDPPFELAYWYWGLTVAQQWRERLGLQRDPEWERVRLNLAAPDRVDGVYLGARGAVDSYRDPARMRDHPSVLGAYGLLPGWAKLDPETMRRTLHLIRERWDWASTWGWDFPLAAMTAARLGEPELALEFLLMDVPKNRYLPNGHNYQSERLRVYLPGNGGLLRAIGLMCAGWEGCAAPTPGFPKDGRWKVRWEEISPAF